MAADGFTIAIDGPAAAGKGTIARALAEMFGFRHLDTGMLYRAVGMKTMDRGRGIIDPVAAEEYAKHLTEEDLSRADLRSSIASQAASRVAALEPVRAALLAYQRNLAKTPPGAVLDGRDIGTVVCPDAEVKVFVTASDAIRALRRYEELTASGADTTLQRVAADLAARDHRDSKRDVAPLKPAEDAHLLDTTELSIDAAVAQAAVVVRTRIEQGRK